MHFPRPEVRIYSLKQKPTTKAKQQKTEPRPKHKQNTSIATCAVGNPKSPFTAEKESHALGITSVQTVVSTLEPETRAKH
jgi:hypothetical protein